MLQRIQILDAFGCDITRKEAARFQSLLHLGEMALKRKRQRQAIALLVHLMQMIVAETLFVGLDTNIRLHH